MPVTKTAKRALRVSERKAVVNTLIISKLEMAIREAKRSKTLKAVSKAISFADRAAKKKVIHKNKAARIKSALSKLVKLKVKAAKSKSTRAKGTSKRK